MSAIKSLNRQKIRQIIREQAQYPQNLSLNPYGSLFKKPGTLKEDHSPSDVNVKLTFTPAGKELDARIKAGKRRTTELRQKDPIWLLSRQELESFKKLEPDLLKWLATDKKNRALFFADPVGAIKKSGVKLNPNLLKKIEQLRHRNKKLKTLNTDIRVGQIVIEVRER